MNMHETPDTPEAPGNDLPPPEGLQSPGAPADDPGPGELPPGGPPGDPDRNPDNAPRIPEQGPDVRDPPPPGSWPNGEEPPVKMQEQAPVAAFP